MSMATPYKEKAMYTLGKCKKCAMWSEIVAEISNGVIQALCMSPDSPAGGDFTAETDECSHFVAGLPLDLDRVPPGQRQRSIDYRAGDDEGQS